MNLKYFIYSSSSKKGGAKRSITIVKEEAVRNTTPVRGKKRKHSEISLESTQVVSVPSPSEPKPKKRGNLYFTFNLKFIITKFLIYNN